MKFKAVFLTLIFLALVSCNKNKVIEINPEEYPIKLNDDGKWGYFDINGEMIIDTNFKYKPTYFKDDYAIIRNNDGSYDYIGRQGGLQGLKLKDATMFSNGLACVVVNNGAPSYINEEFKTVFTLKDAEMAGVFSDGLARFQTMDGKWGFVNKTGEIVIKPSYDYAESFSDGLALVANESGKGIIAGFIDKSGNKVIPMSLVFQNLHSFHEGLAAFKENDGWGFLTKTGDKIIPANNKIEEVTDYHDGYASFKTKDSWGVIDNKGNYTIAPKYKNPVIFYGGLAAVNENGFWGFIDTDDKVVVKPQYQSVALPFLNFAAVVEANGVYFFIDKEGKKINDFEFSDINTAFNEITDLMAFVKSDYFDIDNIANSVISSLTKGSINSLKPDMAPDSVLKDLKLPAKDLKKTRIGFASVQKNQDIGRNASLKTIIRFKNFGSDTSAIDKVTFTIELKDKGLGKGHDLIKLLSDKFLKQNYEHEQNMGRHWFTSDSARAAISMDYGNIYITYEFKKAPVKDSTGTNSTL